MVNPLNQSHYIDAPPAARPNLLKNFFGIFFPQKNIATPLSFQRLSHYIHYDNNRSSFYLDTNIGTYLDTRDNISYIFFHALCVTCSPIILCHI